MTQLSPIQPNFIKTQYLFNTNLVIFRYNSSLMSVAVPGGKLGIGSFLSADSPLVGKHLICIRILTLYAYTFG